MDYRKYQFTWGELAKYSLEYFLLDGAVSLLFYRSWAAFVIFSPGLLLFLRMKREEAKKKRIRELERQFLTCIEAVSNALAAGYSVENAFGEAKREVGRVYEGSLMEKELSVLVTQLSLNRTLEELLLDLAKRSGAEGIRSFAEVFAAAKKSGGNLIAIIRNTAASIRQREETQEEIWVCIAAKKLEQKVMSGVPLLMLAYVSVASPGFLDVMYHNAMGIIVMSICLFVYVLAWILGKHIVEIEV